MTLFYADAEAPAGGDGTINAPFNTLAAFNAARQPFDELLASGTFRETLDDVNNATIAGDGTFEISGAEPLEGLVACDAGDNARIGATLVPLCRKVTVPKTMFVNDDPAAANLCANGVRMPLATSRLDTSETFFVKDPDTYWTAPEVSLVPFGTDGDSYITGFKLPPELLAQEITKASIDQSTCAYVVDPNVSAISGVSYNEGTQFIELAVTDRVYEDSPLKDNFGLLNAAWALELDQWAHWDEGDGTVTLYLRNLNGSIEYSARDIGINIDSTSFFNIENVVVRQTSSTRTASGAVFCSNLGGGFNTVTIRNIEVRDCYGSGAANAAIYIRGIDDLVLDGFKILRINGLAGIFLAGSGASNADDGSPELVTTMNRALVMHGDVRFTSQAPLKLYTMRDSVFWDIFAENTAEEAHGNALNLYQSGYNCVFWAINVQGSGGYITWQESDSLVFAFCANQASGAVFGGDRWMYSQQNSVAKQGDAYGYLGSYALNCRGVVLPERALLTQYQNGMSFTKTNTPLDRWGVANMISPGWSAEGFDPTPIFWECNLDTSAGTKSALQATDEYAPAMYVSPETGDYTYVPSARVRTKAAYDWSGLIPGFRTRWPIAPDRMWETDMAGADIIWGGPVGPTMDVDHDYSLPAGETGPGPDPGGDFILTGACDIVVEVAATL